MTKPPFFMPLADGLQRLAAQLPEPPAWARAEIDNRLVLALNHVLSQEPQAVDRLRRQQGKLLHVAWGRMAWMVRPTAAGLLELADPTAAPDLRLTLTEPSPLAVAQTVLSGQKPPIDIHGDVQLAAEIAWLVDNVRWDLEEDLSRLIGDVAAHALVDASRAAAQAIKGFVGQAGARAGEFKARAAAWRPGGQTDDSGAQQP